MANLIGTFREALKTRENCYRKRVLFCELFINKPTIILQPASVPVKIPLATGFAWQSNGHRSAILRVVLFNYIK